MRVGGGFSRASRCSIRGIAAARPSRRCPARAERIAVFVEVLLPPAGADAQDEPSTADVIDGAGHRGPWARNRRRFFSARATSPSRTAPITTGARVTLVFNITEGDVEGTDVGGLVVAVVADTPKVMTEGKLVAEPVGEDPRPQRAATSRVGQRTAISLKRAAFTWRSPNRHLLVSNARVVLSDGPTEHGHRPAINPLFCSVALAYLSGQSAY